MGSPTIKEWTPAALLGIIQQSGKLKMNIPRIPLKSTGRFPQPRSCAWAMRGSTVEFDGAFRTRGRSRTIGGAARVLRFRQAMEWSSRFRASAARPDQVDGKVSSPTGLAVETKSLRYLLPVVGAITLALGVAMTFASELPLYCRIPGDLLFCRSGLGAVVPISSMVVLGVLIAVLANVGARMFRASPK